MAKADVNEELSRKEGHPIKMISRFLVRNLWFDAGGSSLGEDSWPDYLNFEF